jgi:hypothetical protein
VVIAGYSRILHQKKTDYQDITEILLKVALNTITLTPLSGNKNHTKDGQTGRHDIAEILLEVALNTKIHQSSSVMSWRSVVFKYPEKTTDLTNFIT